MAGPRIYWRIGAFPEFDFIPPERRREVLRRALGVKTYPALIFLAIMRGIVLFLLIAFVLIVFGFELPEAVMAIMLPALCVLSYLLLVRRIRRDVRRHILDSYRGQRLPMCLDCGYNLQATTDENRCPECGAPIDVPGPDDSKETTGDD